MKSYTGPDESTKMPMYFPVLKSTISKNVPSFKKNIIAKNEEIQQPKLEQEPDSTKTKQRNFQIQYIVDLFKTLF